MTEHDEHGLVDAEMVAIEAPELGGPVDPPAERREVYATITSRRDDPRPPIVPAWARNADQRREVARYAVREAGYHTARHASLTPLYLVKVALWAPVGVFRVAWRVGRWTFDAESWGLRQHTATRNDVAGYMTLRAARDKRVGRRLWVTGPGLAVVALGVLLLALLAPWWLRWGAVAVAAPVLAWVGRPADKPILHRTKDGARFTRLTAEQVRAALCALGIAKIREGGDVSFPAPGIHKDGPGWLARVNLPEGVEAVEVLERRGRLSSALRLPVDQVWPTAGPDHAGQLDLWVGYLPSSKMGAPRWPLASSSATTSAFRPFPFGHDERLRPVSVTLFQRNIIIGGQPGSGKTFGGRAIVLGTLLDPTAEVWIAAFKPAEDFHDVRQWCTRYVCGLDDAAMAESEQMVADGLAEVRRRQETIGRLKRAGKITEGCTSPELAAAGLGLHPLGLVFDEVHELLLHSKQAVEDMIRLIKQGRSVGVFVVLITQVASKNAVPPEITRCVTSRWCMSVSDQVANDQIMGTGAYKRGLSGVAYRPEVDAGWGVTTGMAGTYVGAVRAYYPDPHTLAAILARIATVRAGSVFAPAETATPARDVLADVLHVVATVGGPGMHWDTLAETLADQWPEVYGRHTGDSLSALLRGMAVPSEQVKIGGTNRYGVKVATLRRAISAR